MDEKQRKPENGENAKKNEKDPRSDARQEIGSRESIEAMRERLYARGKSSVRSKRSTLSNKERSEPVATGWGISSQKPSDKAPVEPQATHAGGASQPPSAQQPPRSQEEHIDTDPTPADTKKVTNPFMGTSKKRRKYRIKLILAGLVFFVVAMGISSLLIWFGDNTISGENITIKISDNQFSIGGGEELAFQVAISNQNAVPIDAATLIINYPAGTQSASEPGEELFSERIPLDVINSGEAVNVPVKAIIFGEENEEKTITAALEYRVAGSNATFFKEADPLRLKINSSPVSIRVNAVNTISSGQEVDFEVTVSSNAPTALSDVLVKASYPSGFDFSDSSLEPVSGEDTWQIKSLEPEAETSFTVSGMVTGKQSEEKVFRFSIGVPNERDPFNLVSTFAQIESSVEIEQPFLDIGIAVNSQTGSDTVVIDTEEAAAIDITFTNTQDETLYDGVIEAKLTGNAINEVDISVSQGHYDSRTNTLTWDSVDVRGLEEIPPGQSSLVQFRMTPDRDIARTPEIKLEVTARGKRIYDDRVPQELKGTASRVVRIESRVDLTAVALYSTGPFTNTGPIPPVAEKVTQYTYQFEVENGSNDVTNAAVTAVLPSYVTWLDLKTSGDDVTYDSTTRTITWDIGDMDANGREEAAVQVSFVPSFSQVGTTPTILEKTRFRATDRFTGTVLRSESAALTTALYNDPDEDTHNGRVQEED